MLGSFLGITVVTAAAAHTVPAGLAAFAASPERPARAIARGVRFRGSFYVACLRVRESGRTPHQRVRRGRRGLVEPAVDSGVALFICAGAGALRAGDVARPCKENEHSDTFIRSSPLLDAVMHS